MAGLLVILKRFYFYCKVLWLQRVFNAFLSFHRSRYMSPTTQPNAVKRYPCRPRLRPNRIFKPANHPAGVQKLPLVICVHGGGMIINTPAADDPIARFLADTTPCVVVNIDYSKAPLHQFPTAYEDVIELCLAVIHDEDLPVDRSKVVLCGSSAGGACVLAASQDARLQGKVLGVMGFYPVCEIVTHHKEKLASRPDPAIPDAFQDVSYDRLLNLYLGDLKVPREDPRLSPGCFVKRSDLPEHVYLIGIEHDMLCHEAKLMAERLAGDTERVGTETGWRAGSVRWGLVKGYKHAFDHFGKKDETEKEKAERLAVVQSNYQAISDWVNEISR